LRAFDFVHRYAESEDDQFFLEKWRPYILRINAIAAAMQALEGNNYDGALTLVEQAIDKITNLEELDDETFKFEHERSLTALRDLAGQIRKKRPMTEVEQLERELKQAIELQEFEEAALLRDRIRELKNQQIC
jgi:excinuclease UvrABC helicase subunit UvrB